MSLTVRLMEKLPRFNCCSPVGWLAGGCARGMDVEPARMHVNMRAVKMRSNRDTVAPILEGSSSVSRARDRYGMTLIGIRASTTLPWPVMYLISASPVSFGSFTTNGEPSVVYAYAAY